jgi:REP element-mobilizing transposase RayT
MATAPDTIKRLVERFQQQSDKIRSTDYKETLIRIDFINPLMKSLGWDIDNSAGYAEQYREVVHEELALRDQMRAALVNPPVTLTGKQALSVAAGFERHAQKCGYQIWACAILPEHTHLVIARHRYKVEQMANLLKGSATAQLISDSLHPLAAYAKPDARPPVMWARHEWKVFLDSDEQIENAIAYVNDNPEKEGKPRQHWSWITPYSGLDKGWTTFL